MEFYRIKSCILNLSIHSVITFIELEIHSGWTDDWIGLACWPIVVCSLELADWIKFTLDTLVVGYC